MSESGRNLITTSLKSTWEKNNQVLYLNYGCILYGDEREIRGDPDAIVARPFGIKSCEKNAAQLLIRKYEDILHEKLVTLLNAHHGTSFSNRFWKIIVGHWLRRYVEAIYYRYGVIKQTLGENDICGFSAVDSDRVNLIPRDSKHALELFDDDEWNSEVYGIIIRAIAPLQLKGRYVNSQIKKTTHSNNKSLKNKLKFFLQMISGKFVNDSDGLMINTYLGSWQNQKLAIELGQLPQYWLCEELDLNISPSIETRNRIQFEYMPSSNDEFLNILGELMLSCIPASYLEGYSDLLKKTTDLKWPKNPRFIFTSNEFDTNDLFKLWTALNVERGVQYIVGQHGNNYGTSRYDAPTIEELTSDKFLTWGWSGSLNQHRKAFMLKPLLKLKRAQKKNLLLIEQYRYQRIKAWDTDYEFKKYFMEQQQFVSILDSNINKNLSIRLHSGHRSDKWFAQDRWRNFSSEVFISDKDSFVTALSSSKLVVFSYDSTGILECLASNVPMIAFWQNGLSHLSDEAKLDYQELVDVGIVHFSPMDAANKVNEIWGDIDGWWQSEIIQNAKDKFKKKYANVNQNIVKRLKEIIVN